MGPSFPVFAASTLWTQTAAHQEQRACISISGHEGGEDLSSSLFWVTTIRNFPMLAPNIVFFVYKIVSAYVHMYILERKCVKKAGENKNDKNYTDTTYL